MQDNAYSKESVPNGQPTSSLIQRRAISSCLVAYYMGEGDDPHLATVSFQVVVESNEVTPEPPFLQSKHPLLPSQPLLITLVLQTLH